MMETGSCCLFLCRRPEAFQLSSTSQVSGNACVAVARTVVHAVAVTHTPSSKPPLPLQC
ncbi:unnamed protein product [Periconia digitata]|uniref:Uncharacterized protein n=1 Tax=Periconia digitata TaxID=1303443 RepID=A0A9W4XQV2_9PLEO|nr:unnamed protein product [Periconia digitata]